MAERLNVSVKTIQAYMPYQRGIYGVEDKSDDAIRAQAYRDRMRNAAASQVEGIHTEPAEIITNSPRHAPKTQQGSDPLCLRLMLTDRSGGDPEIMETFRRLGRSESGHILRDIVIPLDMTLHALHYAIQKLFGWQNSHLRNFSLPAEDFEDLVHDDFNTYVSLCGELFLFPIDMNTHIGVYWDDDYREGQSIRNWLRKKYSGPYDRMGECETYEFSQAEAARFKDFWYGMRERNPSLPQLDTLKLSEINEHVIMEQDFNYLLERLPVADILGPVTDELIYLYDYGDDWHVRITKNDTAEIPQIVLEIVTEEHRPICIYKDGLNLVDDVGGIYGFGDFLRTINGSDEEERQVHLAWTRSLGWNRRITAPEKSL